MYARHASRFSMRAGGGSVLAFEAGWFAGAGADSLETCNTSGVELAHDESPQRLATNKLTTAMPNSFNFDPRLAHILRAETRASCGKMYSNGRSRMLPLQAMGRGGRTA
jgi:hypothetical protein